MRGETLDPVIRQIHELVLEAACGNVAHAAKVLNIQRTTLCERIKYLNIDIESIRKRYGEVNKKRISPEDHAEKLAKKCVESHKRQPFMYTKMQYIIACLKEENWNRTRGAARAGVSLRTLRMHIVMARSMGYEVPDSGKAESANGE